MSDKIFFSAEAALAYYTECQLATVEYHRFSRPGDEHDGTCPIGRCTPVGCNAFLRGGA